MVAGSILTRCPTAFKNGFNGIITRNYGLSFEKFNRQKRDLLNFFDGICLNMEELQILFIDNIMLGLKTKNLQSQIVKVFSLKFKDFLFEYLGFLHEYLLNYKTQN